MSKRMRFHMHRANNDPMNHPLYLNTFVALYIVMAKEVIINVFRLIHTPVSTCPNMSYILLDADVSITRNTSEHVLNVILSLLIHNANIHMF